MKGRWFGSLLLLASLGGSGLGCGASRGVFALDAGAQDAAPESLELFTWWVAPGEVEALRSLVTLYKADHPTARVNQFNDASSANWQSMLGKGIDGPRWDVAQISAAGLSGFIKDHPGALAPVDSFYEEPSLKAAVIPDILRAATVDGHAMGVVTGVHRNNAFIYNLRIFKARNIEPPKTIAEFLAVCETLKKAGITPVATPLDAWIMRFLFLDLLSGTIGAEEFGAFIRHERLVSDLNIQNGIKEATDLFVKVLTDYVDVAAARGDRYDWTTAVDAIHADKAAMIFLGDWVKGYLVHLGWTPGVDFGVSGPPGAADLFVYGADTFALPAMAPHPSCANDFLTIVGSKAAQVAFNGQKGSTPMRTDVRDLLDAPGRQNLDDLVNAKVRLPGIDNSQWDDAMAAYVKTGDKAVLLNKLLTITP